MLPDILAPKLKLVICGTAAGTRSAAVAHYYAGRGNKFWRTLHRVGLTPSQLAPHEQFQLLEYGIGLTDLVKGQAGMDHRIDFAGYLRAALQSTVECWKPAVVCFDGKRAASEVLGVRSPQYGVQTDRLADALLFVAPSTSGAANAAWDEQHWQSLASLVATSQGGDERGDTVDRQGVGRKLVDAAPIRHSD